MKICDRAAFLALPEGVIFAKGERWTFDTLSVKGETHGDSFWSLPLNMIDANSSEQLFDRLEQMDAGASFPLNDSWDRNTPHDDGDVVFLVYEQVDLIKLHQMSIRAITIAAEME